MCQWTERLHTTMSYFTDSYRPITIVTLLYNDSSFDQCVSRRGLSDILRGLSAQAHSILGGLLTILTANLYCIISHSWLVTKTFTDVSIARETAHHHVLLETFIHRILNGRMTDRRQICTKDGKSNTLKLHNTIQLNTD